MSLYRSASLASAHTILRSTSSRTYSSSSVPPRPGHDQDLQPPLGAKEGDVDYTEYLAKMDRLEKPKGGLPRANKIAALLTGIPILYILYHMLFPTPIEKNEWFQLEKDHRDRMVRAMEEANANANAKK
jgi:hypothetical protein